MKETQARWKEEKKKADEDKQKGMTNEEVAVGSLQLA